MEQAVVENVSAGTFFLGIVGFFVVWIVFNMSILFKGNLTDDDESTLIGSSGMMGIVISLMTALSGSEFYYFFLETILGISLLIALGRTIAAYSKDIANWFLFHRGRFQKWRETKRNFVAVKKIYKGSKVRRNTLLELGAAIKEWDESKKKLPLLRTSLKKLEIDLTHMSAVIRKMKEDSQKAKLDGDIEKFYTTDISDLEREHTVLSSRIEMIKTEISVRDNRLVGIASFLKNIPEQAKMYEVFDKNLAEALSLQKDIKEDLGILEETNK